VRAERKPGGICPVGEAPKSKFFSAPQALEAQSRRAQQKKYFAMGRDTNKKRPGDKHPPPPGRK
jgi:hypothetical protein